MALRPLTARPPLVLLREAKPLRALFGEAQRLDRLQQIVEQRRLQRQLETHEAFAGLQRILFRVQPPQPTRPAPRQPKQISQASAEHIKASAEGIDDPRLRAALERLAAHGLPRD